jgi:MoaA/NifB/PqqE/SkfB family radical SAM enzyme
MQASDKRWSDIYTNSSVKFAVHVEATTRCNSRCPSCPRFIDSTPITNPALVLDEIKIDEFKAWLPPEFLQQHAECFNFCGNYGDPMMCTDIVEIIEYLVENNVLKIALHTNGGMRNKKVWNRLGQLLNKRNRHVVWSVDGLEDTNNLYRREVKWKNIVNNIKEFNSTGGYSIHDFLVFKHNEHQVEEVKAFFKSLGVKDTQIKSPFGMTDESTQTYHKRSVFDKNGKFTHWLEQADRFRLDNYTDSQAHWQKDSNIPLMEEWMSKRIKEPIAYVPEINYNNKEKTIKQFDYAEDSVVVCKALNEYSEIFLNPNGDIVPCCFMGQIISNHQPVTDIMTREAFKPFSKLNLNHNSIENILGIIDDKVASKWGCSHAEGRSTTCSTMCGQRKDSPYLSTNLYRNRAK